MTTRTPPKVECDRQHPGLYVPDVAAAVDFYVSKLAFTVGFTWGEPTMTMAGVNLDNVQVFLEQGKPSPESAGVYFVVGNADELYEFHRDGGVVVDEPIGDREYGLRDYSIKDLNGYRLTFGHSIFSAGEPIEIERVDLPARLEKRMAAVLRDLAEFKRMSLSSCLEETLLHTFEPLEDGVASPHTKRDIAYIQELKKKHGIDFDSHGSYRFVERR